MLTASEISAMIRSKKKKLEGEDEAVKLSGIPEDATDIAINKNHEYGEMLSENFPKDRDEEPTPMHEEAQEKIMDPHEEMAPDPMEDEVIKLRKARLLKALGGMI